MQCVFKKSSREYLINRNIKKLWSGSSPYRVCIIVSVKCLCASCKYTYVYKFRGGGR